MSPNTISLPKGPGSIEGLGESFQPSLNTGTAKYAIGLKLPPGTAGHTPSLGLNYEGGGGNGPLGYGWSLPLPSIQRQTDHGIPTYGQDIGFPRQDTFINELKEELVPQTNGFFFCKNEATFVRYQPVAAHWEATLPNGTRLLFGLSDNARIQNGTNAQVFSWLLEQEIDTHGNTIVYSYSSFPGDNNLNQKYLSTIRYGPGAPPWSSYHFIALQYEDRPDWFEDGRAGFIVRTAKRLKAIYVGTQGVSLPAHLQGDFDGDGTPDSLDRVYQLSYLNYAGTNSHWSLLASVTPLGADGVSPLPASTFGYAVSDPPDTLSAAGHIIGGTNEPAFVMDNTLVDLVDLNGDGLPDILKTDLDGGAHQGYLNRGQVQLDSGPAIQWDSPIDVDPGAGTAWSYNLSTTDTHLADMDGDGLADLVHKTLLGDVIYFPNLGQTAWGQQQLMSVQDSAPPAPFGQTDVRTADLDFDKRIDIIQSVASGSGYSYRIWFNLGNQTYSPSLTVDQDWGFSFADPTVQIADLNGDRLPDIAQVRPTGLTVTAGLGYGHFAPPIFIALPDDTLTDTQVSQAKLTDLNGDGLADLVIERAAPGQCWYWLNLGNYTFSSRKTITDLPTTLGVNAVVRWADLNGNGTTDLLYADQTSVPKIQTIDLGLLLGTGPNPNTLTAISNGLGRVTLIQYQPSTLFSLADAAAGQPWTNLMPLSVSVVAGVTTLDSLGHSYLTRFQYHQGYYDPQEKQFRGFGYVEQVEVGDASAPTLVTRSYFDTGKAFEAMKGKLLRLTSLQEDGKVFSDALTSWTLPPVVLMTGTNGTNVSFAHPIDQLTQILELGQGTPRTLEQEFTFDTFGNQTRLADYGIVDNGNRSAFNDERITTTQYALNTNLWLLRYPSRQEIADYNGLVLSRTEHYYDEPSFSGNNLGSVTLGDLTLTKAWYDAANPGGYIQATRTKYDAFGNPVTLLDPLATAPGGAVDTSQGHVREVSYESAFHTYPLSETIHVGKGSQPLVYQALYDQGFGTLTTSTDFNTNTTSYGYDTFARLSAVVKPYDTQDYPTTEYSYALAVPYGTNGLVNYIETRQLDKTPGSAGSNKCDAYLISRQFSDGLGRNLMTKQEAEPAPGSTLPRVAVKEAMLFNARSKPALMLNPYFTSSEGTNLDDLLSYENIEDPPWKGDFHENGQLTTLSLSGAHQSSMSYDATLRLTATTNPDGSTVRIAYEPLLTKASDENDTDPTSGAYNTPLIHYQDGLKRLIRADELAHLQNDGTPSSFINTWSTTFNYDVNDCLIKITDSQGNIKSITYDGLKRKTGARDPDRGTIAFEYDAASNLKSSLDAKGQEILYTYDGANRLLTEDYLDENSMEFSYHRTPDVVCVYDQPLPSIDSGDGVRVTARNTKGMLAYVVDTSGEEHNSYDARGRVEWTVKRIPDPMLQNSNASGALVSFQTQFEHDSLDRVTRMIYPDNDQVSYQYNARGLLDQIVGGPSGTIISNILYAPSAQKAQLDSGDGLRTAYSYDRRQRLNALLTAQISDPAAQLLNFAYNYDAVGNIKSIQDQRDLSLVSSLDPRRNSQAFTYDDLNRLTSVQYNAPASAAANGGEIDYRYDRIGNLLAQSSTMAQQEAGLPVANLGTLTFGGAGGTSNRGGRLAGDPPGPHAMTSIANPATTPRVYGYDANGNMTNIDSLTCTWDFKDRLVVAENAFMRAGYTYDYAGRRITKTIDYKPTAGTNVANSGRTSTLYVNKAFEVRDRDQPTKYVFDGSTRIASITGSLSPNTRIQRFRLAAGWNLLSLAVSASNLTSQLAANSAAVTAVYQWNAASSNYSLVGAGHAVNAGAVLWVQAASNVTCGVLGAYTEPSDVHLVPSATYIPGEGLESWSPNLPAASRASIYDSLAQLWHEHLPQNLASASDFSAVVSPGQPLYITTSTNVDLVAPDPALQVRYYHEDHLGSSAVITDARGRLLEENAFFPFGHARNAYQTQPMEEPYQFSQKERDAESGLVYFGKRFYASALGRWLSTDPMEEKGGGFNPYAYVNNNPLKLQDSDGEEITMTQKGHELTIHLTAVVLNDSPTLSKRGYDLDGLAKEIKSDIETHYQGTFTGEKARKGTWTVKTKVDIKVVQNWNQVKTGKHGEHVFLIVEQTYDSQAANARKGGMLMNIGVKELYMKRPSQLTAEELANPANKSYIAGYESPGSIGAHEYGHTGGLSHKPGEADNLMSNERLNDSMKITSEQLSDMVKAIDTGNVNKPDDVIEAKPKAPSNLR